jgi:hypothetical protein
MKPHSKVRIDSCERWVTDENGGHWSNEPLRRTSRYLSRPASRLVQQTKRRLGFLRSLLRRTATLFFRPHETTASYSSVLVGLDGHIWPHACSEDMTRQLGQSAWLDPLDDRVWAQAWVCGAQWAHSNLSRTPPEQSEDSCSRLHQVPNGPSRPDNASSHSRGAA